MFDALSAINKWLKNRQSKIRHANNFIKHNIANTRFYSFRCPEKNIDVIKTFIV